MKPQNVILIDGHNWIHQVPFLASYLAEAGEENARMRAIGQAGVYANTRKKVLVWLLFDGNRQSGGNTGGTGSVRVRFSSPPRTADDDIVAMGEKLAREKVSVTVVTDDRGIHARLAGIGIAFEGAAAFWRRINPKGSTTARGGGLARGKGAEAAEEGAAKEAALNGADRAELDALLARSTEERQARDRERETAAERDARAKRPASEPASRVPGPAVQGRASREDRRRRFEEKRNRGEETSKSPGPKKKKRKKRRGF
jgi:predicted RNA-binding protein with PIN domain